MLTARNYRLYPSGEQPTRIAQHFGCHRVVFNDAKVYDETVRRETGKKVSYQELCTRLPELKRQRPYLKDVDSQMLQQSVMDYCKARDNHLFARWGVPRFKTRRSPQSVRFPQRCRVDEIPNEIVVPKIGTIPSVIHRPVDGIVKSITISKNSAGQYHAAVLVEDEIEQPEECPEGKTLGIDLGLTDFAVTTDDDYIANPKHFKRSRRNLKRKQQDLARCKRGSNRRRKAVLRLARIHLRISNQRKDFLHKISRHLVDENQVIVVENLNIRGMMKNHHLANAIGTAGWGQFVSFCRYKAQRVGKMVLKCGRFVPSSKRCSCCGTVNRDLKLSQRVWTCDACGTVHHRDRNASNNILRGGLLETYPIGYLLDQGILERA